MLDPKVEALLHKIEQLTSEQTHQLLTALAYEYCCWCGKAQPNEGWCECDDKGN